MLVKYVIDTDSLDKLCKRTLREAGLEPVRMEPYETARSDVVLVLFSFSGEQFEDVLSNHQYSRLIFVGDLNHSPGSWVKVVPSIEDVIPILLQLKAESKKASASPIVETSKSQRNRKRRMQKVKCPFCKKDVGSVKLGLKKHLIACRDYQKRPRAFGYMATYRQPNGKSKGSTLTVHLPEPVTVNERLLRSGLHMITDGHMIRLLNAVLKDTFKYHLETYDEATG